MFNFFSKNLPAFGLDVSNGSFKVMQLGRKGKELSLKGCSESVFPKGLMGNDEVLNPEAFKKLLNEALEKPQFGKIDTNYVVASLPESKSFVRVIQIPKMSDSEAENAVPFEAESFIPLPLDQVYLDWQKIGDARGLSAGGGPGPQGTPGGGEKMNILMIASPKAFVDKYLEALDFTGLKPVALELESQSCHRALIAKGSTETTLLVDIEEFRTSLIMIEEGNLQFTSTIPIAGNSFTESIAASLGVGSSKAEQIKRIIGIANTAEYPNIKTSLLPVLNSLSAEIKNILKFHNEHSEKQVERILLSGGGGKLKNLPEFLSSEMADGGVAKVELVNPWQNFGPSKSPLPDPFKSLSFVTAIGLAEKGAQYEIN